MNNDSPHKFESGSLTGNWAPKTYRITEQENDPQEGCRHSLNRLQMKVDSGSGPPRLDKFSSIVDKMEISGKFCNSL